MLLAIDEVITGVKGGKIEFEIAVVDEDGRAVDTTVYDKFRIAIRIDSSTVLLVTHVLGGNGSIMTKVGVGAAGVFKVLINPVDSATLDGVERQDISFEMVENADPTNIIREILSDKLSIGESSF